MLKNCLFERCLASVSTHIRFDLDVPDLDAWNGSMHTYPILNSTEIWPFWFKYAIFFPFQSILLRQEVILKPFVQCVKWVTTQTNYRSTTNRLICESIVAALVVCLRSLKWILFSKKNEMFEAETSEYVLKWRLKAKKIRFSYD